MYKLVKNGAVIAQSEQSISYVEDQFGWKVDDHIFADYDREMSVVDDGVKVSPVQFKLLFTAPERVAIKASTDPVVQDFFEIVNDPRLTFVDLGLQSTKDAIGYLQSKGLLTGERAAAILTGTLV